MLHGKIPPSLLRYTKTACMQIDVADANDRLPTTMAVELGLRLRMPTIEVNRGLEGRKAIVEELAGPAARL